MQHEEDGTRVVPVASLPEYFRDALQSALAHQHVAVEDQTEQYIVNLLALFARSEDLYEQTAEGIRLRPLAHMLGAALEARTLAEREHRLQRLGDVALFIAGFFAHGFARKLVDVDYHVAMGGRAYGTLAETLAGGRRRVLATVFAELAAKFQPLVDALWEISDSARIYTQADVLRLYEIWLKTGSRRARTLLGSLDVDPSPVALRAH
jgi:hypothetical protein